MPKLLGKRNFTQSSSAPVASGAKAARPDVDAQVAGGQNYEVHQDDSGKYYNCYLMNSNCDKNNNKYYILQLLKSKGTGSYYIHSRYGRVGHTAASSCDAVGCLEQAVRQYNKTYSTKTSASKGYKAIDMKVGADATTVKANVEKDSDESTTNGATAQYEPSRLDGRVQELISFINDQKLMEKSMVQVGYDVKKLPLGQLSDQTVQAGYKTLREIENIFQAITSKTATLTSKMPELKRLSNEFYSTIPHDFGFAKMINFVIDTQDKLKQKMDLISNLVDIKTAYSLRRRGGASKPAAKKAGNKKQKLEPSLVDQNYDVLKCKMEALSKGDKEYEMLETYC